MLIGVLLAVTPTATALYRSTALLLVSLCFFGSSHQQLHSSYISLIHWLFETFLSDNVMKLLQSHKPLLQGMGMQVKLLLFFIQYESISMYQTYTGPEFIF